MEPLRRRGAEVGFYGLGLHLATGASLDPEAEQTWTLSPEGTAYVQGCGEGWYRADAAGGGSEADARARADASVTFYTVLPEEAPEGDPAADQSA